jgi:hypothetical protein
MRDRSHLGTPCPIRTALPVSSARILSSETWRVITCAENHPCGDEQQHEYGKLKLQFRPFVTQFAEMRRREKLVKFDFSILTASLRCNSLKEWPDRQPSLRNHIFKS